MKRKKKLYRKKIGPTTYLIFIEEETCTDIGRVASPAHDVPKNSVGQGIVRSNAVVDTPLVVVVGCIPALKLR